ncbi:MAG TPA: arginase [Bacteroidales bacterium]|nr:arginase [Bacteroidales bacterium]
MEYSNYFEPARSRRNLPNSRNSFSFANIIQSNCDAETTLDISDFDMAIIGVPEYRNAPNYVQAEATTDAIRSELFELFPAEHKIKIVDLGNIKLGETPADTMAAVRDITIALLESNTLPVFIGGTNDLVYAIYNAYHKLNRTVNLVSVDSMPNIGASNEPLSDTNYISKIVSEIGEHLFNYTIIGTQGYLFDKREKELVGKLLFENFRLGSIRTNLDRTEPVFRDADLVSFDMCAVKHSDSPACPHASPNGLYAEDMCRLARYAGMSDKLSAFGIFGLSIETDIHNTSAKLAAQIIWHFIDGFYRRKNDFPKSAIENYTKFIVTTESESEKAVFYKNTTGDRWWMEVPHLKSNRTNNLIISCNYEDYKKTCEGELPERWWKYYNKIN